MSIAYILIYADLNIGTRFSTFVLSWFICFFLQIETFSISESCWQTRHSQFLHLHRQLRRPSHSPFRSFLQRFVRISQYKCQQSQVHFAHFRYWYFIDNSLTAMLTKYIIKCGKRIIQKMIMFNFWDNKKPARVRSPLGRLCMMNRKCSMDIVESLNISIVPGYIIWPWKNQLTLLSPSTYQLLLLRPSKHKWYLLIWWKMLHLNLKQDRLQKFENVN